VPIHDAVPTTWDHTGDRGGTELTSNGRSLPMDEHRRSAIRHSPPVGTVLARGRAPYVCHVLRGPMSSGQAQTAPAMTSASTIPSRSARRRPEPANLTELLDQMAPTTLAQMDAVSLLDRIDTKFLLTVPQLASILPALAQDYLVLDIRGRRLHQYRTLYFDSPGYDLYRRHQCGHEIRHKVRSRHYVDTDISVFEIKSKQSGGRTVKHRLTTPAFLTDLTPEASAFVASHLPAEAGWLRPTLRNSFLRVTLVGRRCVERLTVDVHIHFECDARTAILPGVAIVELKQGESNQHSPFLQRMQAAHLRPMSVSKYCVGVALLIGDMEHDAFERQLTAIEDLTRDAASGRTVIVTDSLPAPA
jgi:VTC domain-containing protein